MRRSDVAEYFGCSDAYIKVKIRKYLCHEAKYAVFLKKPFYQMVSAYSP